MDRRLFIGAGVLGTTAALRLAPARAAAPETKPMATIEPDDMVLGSPKAKITVIEYASASCPHCAKFNNEVFPAFKAKYIDTGKVRYAFREFLTEPVNFAAASYLMARCAGKDKYFSVIDAVFRAQADIYASNEMKDHFTAIAAAAGMDQARLDACLADTKALAALQARVQRYASRDGVESTPTFLINGVKMTGEHTLAAMDAAIAAAQPKGATAHHRRRHG